MTLQRAVARIVLPALLLIAAAGVLAPYLSAAPYRERIRAALQRALHRDVQVGEVHYNLFRGPGFEVQDVLIGDDPSAGVEPFAYVASLQATVRLASLWSGHLSFSTLRLTDANVNLVKTAAGPWNIQTFLPRPSADAGPSAAWDGVPDIQIRSGRLNFKFADTKSIFYFSDADVDVYPADSGAIDVRFSGAPARTDRGAQGFGHLTARGLLRPASNGERRLNLGVQLEPSDLSEIITLFAGYDPGVHGLVSANAHFDGALSAIAISGNMNVSGLHRWDLMPAQGDGWPFAFQGKLDLPGQNLELETSAAPGQTTPVTLRFSAANYLLAPRWSITAALRDLPASGVADAARHFGLPLPPGIGILGTVEGTVDYSTQTGVSGDLTLLNATIAPNDGSRAASAAVERAALSIHSGRLVFGPADVLLPEDQRAVFQAEYLFPTRHLSMRFETARIGVAEVQSGAGRLLAAIPLPLLPLLHEGTLRGEAIYEITDGQPGAWSGKFNLQGAQIALPDFSAPIEAASAAVSFEQDKLRISRLRGSVGKIEFEADLRYDASAKHPVFLQLTVPSLDAARFERLALPLLGGREGLLSRLPFGRPAPPSWLLERDLEGAVHIESLSAGGVPGGTIDSRMVWTGASLEFPNLRWKLEGAQGSGKLSVLFTGAAPRYRLTGQAADPDWRDGKLAFDGSLTAVGSGAALLSSISAKGNFTAAGVLLAPGMRLDSIAGTFQLAPGAAEPKLALEDLQASLGPEAFTGRGASQPDGRILLDLNSATRQLRQLTAGLHMGPAPESDNR